MEFHLRWQTDEGFEEYDFVYENGIIDYVTELAGGTSLTAPVMWSTEAKGRDREDKEDYTLKADVSFCFSNVTSVIEYYHNSSFLEHGGSPEKAVRSALLGDRQISEIDRKISQKRVEDQLCRH